jgi:hypothetical protein
MYKRNGNKWTINETLKLQREFELLELSINKISILHKRSPYAIAIRLVDEGFASQENTDVSQYLSFSNSDNISDTISDIGCDSEMSYSINTSSNSDVVSEIDTLKSQVSDLNSKIDSILSMLRRSNGGSIIGMY